MAAAAHAHAPDRLTSFTSDIESEVGILIRRPHGGEVPTPARRRRRRRREIHLDAVRHEIVRFRGRLLGRRPPPSLLARLLDATIKGYIFVDLENAEWDGSVWLPHRQRVEVEAKPSLSEDLAILRLTTNFTEVHVNVPLPGDTSDAAEGSARRVLAIPTADSLRGFAGWRRELGAVTAEGDAGDFDDVAPDVLRSTGPPRLRVGTGGLRTDRERPRHRPGRPSAHGRAGRCLGWGVPGTRRERRRHGGPGARRSGVEPTGGCGPRQAPTGPLGVGGRAVRRRGLRGSATPPGPLRAS